MPRIIHFEIVANDPQGAMNFYKSVFGWEFNKWDGPQEYWQVKTGEDNQPGIDGGLTPISKGDPNPVSRVTNTIDVSSVDDFSKKITSNGGKVLSPKIPIPGTGYLVICQDTVKISFGILERDPNAK